MYRIKQMKELLCDTFISDTEKVESALHCADLIEGELDELQDKLHRRNMQIKELKRELEELKKGGRRYSDGHPRYD